MFKTPALKDSFEKFMKAEQMLKPYVNKIMPESQIKQLIHEAGIETFPRPAGIPDNFIIKLTDKNAGMKYIDLANPNTSVRVMPGKPHSPWPHQQKSYVIQIKNGKAIDKYGNLVDPKSPEAHIPLEEFTFRY